MDVFDLLRTNLHSAILLARGFRQRHCHATGSGMVLLSSVMGLVGTPMVSVYSGTKSALMGFARSLAVELANQRIRVNCSAPAFVRTEMLGQVKAMLSPERFAALEKAHPLGFGTPRDLANAVAFLLADTGRWITGSTLVVDGGHSAQ
jgi:NAD(P)-dependent dehydrogenase (short-subunit alcohol dehydrogenase family)